jgi:hypothetical protein
LNPREIWLMVVLIVGISLAGYIVYKSFGEQVGIVVGGILGGLISSTATTISYARRAVNSPATSRSAAIVIMVASTVVFGRILLEIGASGAVVSASCVAADFSANAAAGFIRRQPVVLGSKSTHRHACPARPLRTEVRPRLRGDLRIAREKGIPTNEAADHLVEERITMMRHLKAMYTGPHLNRYRWEGR